MRSENTLRFYRDIAASIASIESFVGAMNFAAYEEDMRTKRAVEREIQILTEAAIRLGEDPETRCPGPDWRGLRGMGNFLRHNYEHVSDRLVWNTIKDDLPQLKQVVLVAIAQMEPRDGQG